ncbi:hypothetical protein SLS55_005022 [Diplodia seriata]|uniref:Cytochrome p450 n=1 Tax=Diplodia seriata TaxID=420778 RepID=A0ABR3CF79_9PEZI
MAAHLDGMHCSLHKVASRVIERELSDVATRRDEWSEAPLFELTKSIIAEANALVFFGDELSNDAAFVKAAAQYPEELFLSAEILRLSPSWAVPLIARALKLRHRACRDMADRLTPIVKERWSNACNEMDKLEKQPSDCIDFFIDASRGKKGWTVEKIVQVLLGVWFASVHQPALALAYALDDLCRHPEYVGLLRHDLESTPSTAPALQHVPLLDSFLKESARLHPSEAISVRRQAIKHFTFSDGLQVNVGEVICLPLNAMLQDPVRYPDPQTFDGFRFVRKTVGTNHEQRFCNSSNNYPIWGLGSHAWYAFTIQLLLPSFVC